MGSSGCSRVSSNIACQSSRLNLAYAKASRKAPSLLLAPYIVTFCRISKRPTETSESEGVLVRIFGFTGP